MSKGDSVSTLSLLGWTFPSLRRRVDSIFGCDSLSRCHLWSHQIWFQTLMKKQSRMNLIWNKLMHLCLNHHGSDPVQAKTSIHSCTSRRKNHHRNRIRRMTRARKRKMEVVLWSFHLILKTSNSWGNATRSPNQYCSMMTSLLRTLTISVTWIRSHSSQMLKFKAQLQGLSSPEASLKMEVFWTSKVSNR